MKNLYRIALTFTIGMLSLFVGTATAELVVNQSYQLVNKTRVGRTAYEYTYQVNITNNGSDVQNATASVTSSSPNTTIIDGDVSFGDVAGGTTVTGSDTFIFRQSRRVAFDPEALTWSYSYQGFPPDPGEAGKATIAGVDSDNDGIRDDIQRFIELNYGGSQKTKAVLQQTAIALQKILVNTPNSLAAQENAETVSRAIECSYYINPTNAADINDRLRSKFLNTVERSRAYLSFDAKLSGKIIIMKKSTEYKSSCTFDPNTMED